MNNRLQKQLSASCACGKARVRYSGPVLSAFLCTCTECQKVTGSGHAAAIMGVAEGLEVSGETKSFTRKADSGADLVRRFCPECATTLFSTSSRAPDIVLLPAGLFDTNGWYTPKRVIFHRSHRDWDVLPDIPRHDTYPENENA